MKRRSFAQTVLVMVESERRASYMALSRAYIVGVGISEAEARHARISAAYDDAKRRAMFAAHAGGGLWS